MNYEDIKRVDTANGIGIRVSLFVSGCTHGCKGCFNGEAWDFKHGEKFTEETKNYILGLLQSPWIKGLSVLGGEPLQQDETLMNFLESVKSIYPEKDIWLYTGYVYDQVKNMQILKYVDVLVDGPFIAEKKNVALRFRGSSNQRIIDMKETRKQGKIVLYNKGEENGTVEV